MPDDLYARADPDGVIARFAGTSPIARSPEGTYVAWRFSLRDGRLDPADAAAVVLAAGAGRWRRWPHGRLRRLLERTSGGRRHPANDDHEQPEA
jgi:hypothetical protein